MIEPLFVGMYAALCGGVELASRHGADEVINVKTDDAIQKVMEITNGQGCDIVFETAGSPYTLAFTWKYVKTAGVIVNVGNASGEISFVFGELDRLTSFCFTLDIRHLLTNAKEGI